MNVLVIHETDKEPLQLQWLAKEWGCHVFMTNDFQMAYKKLTVHAFDIILMDVGLTSNGEFAFLRRVNQNPGLKNIPILFLSVSSKLHDIEKAFVLGVRDYIVKPYNMFDLKNKIALMLNDDKQL